MGVVDPLVLSHGSKPSSSPVRLALSRAPNPRVAPRCGYTAPAERGRGEQPSTERGAGAVHFFEPVVGGGGPRRAAWTGSVYSRRARAGTRRQRPREVFATRDTRGTSRSVGKARGSGFEVKPGRGLRGQLARLSFNTHAARGFPFPVQISTPRGCARRTAVHRSTAGARCSERAGACFLPTSANRVRPFCGDRPRAVGRRALPPPRLMARRGRSHPSVEAPRAPGSSGRRVLGVTSAAAASPPRPAA